MKYNFLFDEITFNNSKSKDLFEIKCDYCNIIFKKSKNYILKEISIKSLEKCCKFCSQSCFRNSTKKKYGKCITCIAQLTGHQKKFCSKSCSASFNNRKCVKRKSKYEKQICEKCSCLFSHTAKRKFCSECKPSTKNFSKNSINELGSNYRRKIHYHAKQITSNLKKECFLCGYNLYTEICHIKPVKEFSKDSKLEEINSLSNLMILCPNCHKEFDNNLSDTRQKIKEKMRLTR